MGELWAEEASLAEYKAGWRRRAMAVNGMEKQANRTQEKEWALSQTYQEDRGGGAI